MVTLFSRIKKRGNIGQKFSDHLGIKTKIKLPTAVVTKTKKKEIINYRNEEGWEKYAEYTDKSADTISNIVNNKDLTIDEVREGIMTKDLETQKSCFGTVWVGPGKKKRRRNKSSKDLKDRFKEEWDELNELVETGASYKDVTRRM